MKLPVLTCSPLKGTWLQGDLFVLLEHFAGEIIIQSAELEFIEISVFQLAGHNPK
jgi:hypothetical protein